MSRACLLKVYKSKASWELELANSHGGAAVLWNYLWKIYCSDGFEKSWFMAEGQLDRLDKILDDPKTPLHHKAGLILTYDRSVILKEHLLILSTEFQKLASEMCGFCAPEHFVNHWPEIARWITDMAMKDHDHRLIGIALNATSVADVWDDYPKPLRTTPIMCTSALLFPELEKEKVA